MMVLTTMLLMIAVALEPCITLYSCSAMIYYVTTVIVSAMASDDKLIISDSHKTVITLQLVEHIAT